MEGAPHSERIVRLSDETSSAVEVERVRRELDPEALTELVLAGKAEAERRVRISPPTALTLARSLVALAPGDTRRESQALRASAVVAHFNGENERARDEFLEAIERHDALGEELETAIARRSLVEVCHQLGRSAEAMEHASAARETFERLGERQLLAELETNVGNVLIRLDEYPRAREHYERARELFSELDNSLGLAFVNFNLAVCEMNASRIDEARAAWERARAGMAVAGHGMHVADCDYNLAYLQSRAGEFREAVEGLERARGLYRENGKPSGVPLCDLDLSEIYLRLGSADLGLEHARAASDRFGELGLAYEKARADTWIGLAHAALGNVDAARDAYRAAWTAFGELGNEPYELGARLRWAALEVDAGVPEEAARHAALARDAFERRDLRWPSAMASMVLVRSHLAAGRAEEALAELGRIGRGERGEALAGVDLGELVELERLCLEARARDLLGDRSAAIDNLRVALARLDAAYENVPSHRTGLDFLREQHQAYLELTFLLADGVQEGGLLRDERRPAEQRRDDLQAALAVLEEGRLHALEQRTLDRVRESPELARARARLESMLAQRLEKEIGLELDGEGPESPLVRAVVPADADLLEAQAELRAAEGTARRPAAPRSRVDFDELAAALDEDEAALVFAVGPRGTLGFRVERGDVHGVRLDADAEWLDASAERLRFHFDRLRMGAEWQRSRLPVLQRGVDLLLDELGDRLLAPLLEGSAARALVLVPFGSLHDLPLHALRVGGAPVIAERDVSYAYGLASLGRLRHAHGANGAQRRMHLLDAGGELTHASTELDTIERRYANRAQRIELEDLRRAGSRLGSGALHVAGHGMFRPEHPEFSALSDGTSFLFARDVSALQLSLDLVVLSGCETGRPSKLRGEELVGLPRSFLSAGARAVVASFWPVEDAAAEAWMARFYAGLTAGRTVREATNGAWRTLAGVGPEPVPALPDPDPEFALPSMWAAFAVFGDPGVRFPAPAP